MRKKLSFFFAGLIILSANLKSQNVVKVFDKVLFYDGYSTLDKLASEIVPLPAGFFRLKTSLITTKLSEAQLNQLSGTIKLDVVIKAACDNYDRAGHVNIAFVPKNAALYSPDSVQRIEIARFITPFMNKNIKPDTVPYSFQVDYLQHIFQDQTLRENYDLWIELDLFGVPYAANTQVAGCSGRNDTFFGTLTFTTSETANFLETDNVFIPLYMQHGFNNYKAGSTDTLGMTILNKTFSFEKNLIDAQLVLITSNHGANTNGEEYNRRWHYVYIDGAEVLKYKPGRNSCEPFRVYNTQANGIYGSRPRTDATWQSFSNWCPGDVIDTRIINLGKLQAGNYVFTINVPDAVFPEQQGNFPLSLYFQGKTENLGNNVVLYPNPVGSSFLIKSSAAVSSVLITTISGQNILKATNVSTIDMSAFAQGIYLVSVELVNGSKSVHKIIKI